MNQQTPTDYFINKQKRDNLLFRIEPTGESYYLAGQGVKLTSRELDQYYPLGLKIRTFNPDKWKGENSDKTKNWMYLLLPFILISTLVYGQDSTKYKFRVKEHILPASLIFVAGALEGVQDHLAFHNRSNHPFWGQNSYLNKYKDRDPSKGKTFRGKYLVFTTDGFHLMKFSKNLFTMGAVATKISLSGKKRWHIYILEGLAYWAVNRLSFNITYNAFK